jgi:glycosyltransferase involved in cell wall biosynthesis
VNSKKMHFSVITPSYNQLEWLELCIASVCDQVAVRGDEWRVTGGESLKALSVEHIVCDGGSAGIEEFQKRMLERFPNTSNYRLEFVIGPDEGMYDAINKGLRRAQGEICSYLNCDEQLLPAALARVGDYFSKQPDIDVVFGDAILVDREGAALCYWRPYVPTLNHLSGATLNTLSCSTFFRRGIAERGHLFEPQWKAIGDLQWIRGLLEARCSMGCLHHALAAFTYFGDNLGASEIAKKEFDLTRIKRSGVQRVFRRGIHFVRKALSGAYLKRSVTYKLFALGDSSRRREHHHPNLGWTWPGSRG